SRCPPCSVKTSSTPASTRPRTSRDPPERFMPATVSRRRGIRDDRGIVPRVPRGSPQTERLVETIELLAARRHVGATATAIARHLGVDRATCYPMLRELCHFGWLMRDAPTKRFFLGPALIAVGATATTAVDVIDA